MVQADVNNTLSSSAAFYKENFLLKSGKPFCSKVAIVASEQVNAVTVTALTGLVAPNVIEALKNGPSG